jgi:hypothetical protein
MVEGKIFVGGWSINPHELPRRREWNGEHCRMENCMGFFWWLFGPPKKPLTPQAQLAMKEETARKWEELDRWVYKMDFARNILSDYGAVLEDNLESGRLKKPPLYLYPESILPYPKDIIEWALRVFWDEMEKNGKEVYWDLTKTSLLIGSRALHEHFAPDEEIPADPHLNGHAFMERCRRLDPCFGKLAKNFTMTSEAFKAFFPSVFELFQEKGLLDDFLKSWNSRHG